MPVILISPAILARYGAEIEAAWPGLELLPLPKDPAVRLPAEELARVDFACFSLDLMGTYSRAFFAAAQGAPNLRWLHAYNAGVDNPVFSRILDRGVRVTTSAGATAKPIAQTAIGGMLMLARPFLAWGESQRRRQWAPIPPAAIPEDLAGQQMTVLGLGAIGSEIARVAGAIGLRVTGVRRSPWRDGDAVDTVVPPSRLLEIAPTTDWLAVACPLTTETRGIVTREVLAALKPGARVLNIARGEVIDEPAMVEMLASGHLGGAYLDVFAEEPLPAESALWDMPNVIISPHNSAVAAGNERRATTDYFLENLRRMAAGRPLLNEVGPATGA